MSNIAETLAGERLLGMDTAPFIYFVEEDPRYDTRVTPVFQRIADGSLIGVTSIITLVEVLVQPYALGASHLISEYRDLLLNSAGLRTIEIDADIAERAAELRARYRLRTPDALQLAAALSAGCQAFLTNDHNLARVAELRVLTLDELEP